MNQYRKTTYSDILNKASKNVCNISGKILDIVDITKPSSLDYAIQLSKVISKLSPLIGNMIEISIVDILNKFSNDENGYWVRQDPGFPDAIFKSNTIMPNPGIEIKAWFPISTEITARFKDSVKIFEPNHINVALVAWLPEYVIFGKPKILDVLVVSGKSVAEARDLHYHKPPKYIVIEPEDTSSRKRNLQQTNTNGYKFQEERANLLEAEKIVAGWGEELLKYSPNYSYQELLRSLQSKFAYRLDTNYAKIDRIEHSDIEHFKRNVLDLEYCGMSIKEWAKVFSSNSSNKRLASELDRLLCCS